MEFNDKQEQLLRKISPIRMRNYLIGTGWKEVTAKFDNIILFQYGEEQILVPIKTGFIDYPRRVKELIENLSQIENRNEIEILNEFLLPVSEI